MFCTPCLWKQVIRFTGALLVASAATAITVVGQTASGIPSTDCSAYASVPLPPEAEAPAIPRTFPACASYRSYRGIGRPINNSEARTCAWKERLAQKAHLRQNSEQPTAWVVGGSLILADIYFNGAGVKRDMPLAMRFACESEEGIATLALADLAKPHATARDHGPFEFCDYAASTFTMNFCSAYTSEIDDDRRSRFYRSLKSSMTKEQQAAFEKLIAAENTYVDAHASEVDQGGTIRGIRTLGSQFILNDLFHTEVVHFEREKWPAFSDRQATAADAVLHREYLVKLRELGAQTKENVDEGAVTAANLASVEKAWQIYRDAWFAFARLRYPVAASRIRTKITLDRYQLLKTIAAYN